MGGYQFQWHVLNEHMPALLLGAWTDVWVSLVGFVLACLLGLVFALGRLSGIRIFSLLSVAYINAARAIPPYVLLLWIHFGVARLLGTGFQPLHSIIAVLALTGAGYAAEVFRAGIAAIDQGQFEASKSLGMGRFRTYTDVIIPQSLGIVIAPLGNVMIGLLKSATLMGVIAVPDLLHEAQTLNMNSFVPFEAFTAVLFIFVSIVFAISLFVLAIERAVAHP